MALLCRECGIIGPNNAPNTTRIAAKTRHERDTRMAAHADPPTDSLDAWFRHYQQLAVTGVRSVAVAQKMGFSRDTHQNRQ